jgi:hypothetical protein
MCWPYRTNQDIKVNGSYVRKLRQVYETVHESYGTILQNIQDIRNAVRHRSKMDQLEKVTEAYKGETNDDSDDKDENNDLGEKEQEYINNFLLDFGTIIEYDDDDRLQTG